MIPSRNPYGLTLCPTAHLSYLLQALHHDRDVRRALADLRRPAIGTRPPALQRRTLVHPRPGDEQVLRDRRALFCVGDGRVQELLQHPVGPERGQPQDAPRVVHVPSPDEVDRPPQLSRRDPDVLCGGACFHRAPTSTTYFVRCDARAYGTFA